VRTPAYGAAKAAVIHYTRTQAAALATTGIRVNCVAPGSIEFPGGSWERRRTDDPALYNSVLAACPAGRLGKPEEVANVVLFLASPFASWITAQIIGVNGGQGLRGA
jgi:3-oxoacyl-[acyl-carrier protein] reductase